MKHDSWLSDEAITAKRARRKHEKQYKRTRSDDDRVEYRRACRRANKLIIESRQKQYEERLEQATDQKSVWNISNEILHRNGAPSSSHDDIEFASLCSKFKDFFIGEITNIKSNIASKTAEHWCRNLQSDKEEDCSTPSSHTHFTGRGRKDDQQYQVQELSERLDSHIGTETMWVFSLQPYPTLPTSPSLLVDFHQRSGRRHVIPLLKKKDLDKDDPKNYRPITNLVTISKILERLASSRLKPHIHKTGNFSEY